jgi:hypothetical protein
MQPRSYRFTLILDAGPLKLLATGSLNLLNPYRVLAEPVRQEDAAGLPALLDLIQMRPLTPSTRMGTIAGI